MACVLRVALNGYTESQIIPNTSKKTSKRGISWKNIRDNFLRLSKLSDRIHI